MLRKKLHEHELASKYAPFKPYDYKQFFINFRVTEETLHNLIETIKSTNTITIDIESVVVPHKPNKPALVQIQLLLTHSFSYVILIEICHLPSPTKSTFPLIQLFFQCLFYGVISMN